uniref:DNA-directed RNA polymerase I subunit RPA49 n=1 Tax=Noccaea caerulescens TaxID=107243 RepID=A0A1J3G8U3_NOCCA
MVDEHENDYMDEEDAFKTPQLVKKNKKRKNKSTSETENRDEDDDAATIDISVKQISEKPDRIPPIVAYFASGYDPSSQSGDRGSPNVTVYRHKAESKKRLEVVVSPPGSSVEFVGSNYTGEQAARQTCVYTLGVLDKEAQTLRILPIAHNKVFRLEPRVKKETVNSEAAESAVITELSDKERQIKGREKLNSKFGTKSAINRDKKKKALNLGADPDAQDSDDRKLAEVNSSALESTDANVSRNIPPHDVSATTPGKAYPLEKIIDNGEWTFLRDIYKLVQHETGTSTDEYPVFVRNRLYRLQEIRDETEKETVSVVLSLLTHLIKFKDLNSLDGFSSAKNHKFPGIIRQKCKRLFKDSDEGRMPNDKINLLISYVLVLALHVDNFKTDPEDIAKDLRISQIELRKHLENLGCKYSRDKSNTFYSLHVPLKFPQIMRKRRR